MLRIDYHISIGTKAGRKLELVVRLFDTAAVFATLFRKSVKDRPFIMLIQSIDHIISHYQNGINTIIFPQKNMLVCLGAMQSSDSFNSSLIYDIQKPAKFDLAGFCMFKN